MRPRLPALPGLICALALIGHSLPAAAWGPTGHRAVARIAEQHLTPTAKTTVRALVGPAGLAPVATWADSIKSDPRYIGGVAGMPDTRPWHYINQDGIDDFPEASEESSKAPTKSSKAPTKSSKASRDGIRHLIDAIRHFEAVLADRKQPRDARVEALKWLVHLYGDLHQPLHVGRAADKGGNTVDVQWFGQRSNLHRVWDSGIIDRSRLSFTELVEFVDHASADEIHRRQAGDLRAWTAEGIELRPAIYDLPLSGHTHSGPPQPRLGYAYFDRHQATVHDRLLSAGLRLAARLNTLLAD